MTSVERIKARTEARKAAGLIPNYAAKVAKTRVSLPCRFVGEDSGPKGWHVCDNETEPLGLIVCACKGCGPRCPGYQPVGG